MPTEPRPAKVPVVHSTEGTSGPGPGAGESQLSSLEGVQSDVSSVAMDRRLLAVAGAPQPATYEAGAGVAEGQTDAEIMLQVKHGDDSAFAYLVQKYRRPMLSFMFRMAHNASAAEDLAQEVFLDHAAGKARGRFGFCLPGAEIPPAHVELHVPHGAQRVGSRRPGPGSVPARVSLAREL